MIPDPCLNLACSWALLFTTINSSTTTKRPIMTIIKRISDPDFDNEHNHLRKQFIQWVESGHDDDLFLDEFRGLTCGATTRKGTPCKQVAIYENGRCKFHGGLSTGPRTMKGKRASAANLKQWRGNQKSTPQKKLKRKRFKIINSSTAA